MGVAMCVSTLKSGLIYSGKSIGIHCMPCDVPIAIFYVILVNLDPFTSQTPYICAYTLSTNYK